MFACPTVKNTADLAPCFNIRLTCFTSASPWNDTKNSFYRPQQGAASTYHSTEDLHQSCPDSHHLHHISSAGVYSDLWDTGSCSVHTYGVPLRTNRKEASSGRCLLNQFFTDEHLKLRYSSDCSGQCFAIMTQPVQLASSDQSLQSLSPSQRHASRMQTPRAHVNSPGPHWWDSGGLIRTGLRSRGNRKEFHYSTSQCCTELTETHLFCYYKNMLAFYWNISDSPITLCNPKGLLLNISANQNLVNSSDQPIWHREPGQPYPLSSAFWCTLWTSASHPPNI